LSRRNALAIRDIVKGHLNPMEIPKLEFLFRDFYRHPGQIFTKLIALNHLLDGFGVEAIREEKSGMGKVVAEYVNMGDTYNATILYNVKSQNFYVTTWGDFVERNRI
jgi:hypothetical protein